MGNLINKKMNLNKREDKLQQREKENAQAEKLVLSVRKFELYSEFLVKYMVANLQLFKPQF